MPANRRSPIDTWVGEAACSSRDAGLSWEGVTCSADGRVASLNLSALGASGPLEALSPLTALTDLRLASNNFSGATWRLVQECFGVPLPPAAVCCWGVLGLSSPHCCSVEYRHTSYWDVEQHMAQADHPGPQRQQIHWRVALFNNSPAGLILR